LIEDHVSPVCVNEAACRTERADNALDAESIPLLHDDPWTLQD